MSSLDISTYMLLKECVLHVVASQPLSSVASWTCSTLVPLQEVSAGGPRETRGKFSTLIHRLAAVFASPISSQPPWAHTAFKLCICDLSTGHTIKARLH